MKASELMIGDWYQWYADGRYYLYQVKVDDFSKDYVANFDPIPLTEEILKANGFVYDPNNDGNNVWVLRRERKYRVDIYPYYQATVINISSDIADRIGENNCHICYQCHVHELQHALRLCGLEEIADNFKIK